MSMPVASLCLESLTTSRHIYAAGRVSSQKYHFSHIPSSPVVVLIIFDRVHEICEMKLAW